MHTRQHSEPIHQGISTLSEGQAICYDIARTAVPYRLQVGDTVVNIRYRAGGPSLQQKMTQLCQEMD